MNIERFRHLAEAYGAEIERWPAADQDAARALSERSGEARRVLAQGRILDAWLDLAAPEVGDAQVDRVFDAIQDRLDPPAAAAWIAGTGGAPRSLWPTAGFLALMGLFGFVLGDLGVVSLWPAPPSGFTSLVASTSSPIAWDQ
ncbi:hypothetical protein [Azospirillum sp. sgz301742]